MTSDPQTTLIGLSDTDLVLSEPDQDVRGRDVVDRNGTKIGSVDDLMIDSTHRHVRFLNVGAGGFLGIGERHILIPVDAIARIDDDAVHVNADGTHVADAPHYDPDLIRDPTEYYTQVYDYYGYPPYWTPGYTYPPYILR